MKKHILLISAAFLILQTINLNAQENRINTQKSNNLYESPEILKHPENYFQTKNSKIKEIVAKPRYVEYYAWYNPWAHLENRYLKYDDNGNKIEEIFISCSIQDTVQKSTWVFDEQGNMTEYFNYFLDNGNLNVQIGYRYIYEYDEFNNVQKSTTQLWDDGTWGNLNKSEFELGSQGEWLNCLTYAWEDEEWVEDNRLIDIVWHNWDKWQVKTMTIQYWEDEWVNSERNNFTYEGDNYVGVFELFYNSWNLHERETFTTSDTLEVRIHEYFGSEGWKYHRRYSYFYNEYGDLNQRINDLWENNSWILLINDLFLLTYNENDELIEEIHESYHSENQMWFIFWKYLYGDYQYFELGTSELEEDVDFRIFPNPANDFITIDLQCNTKEYNIRVFNILGQEVYKDKSAQKNTVVDLAGLPDGLYIVQIELDGNRVVSKKFMKQ